MTFDGTFTDSPPSGAGTPEYRDYERLSRFFSERVLGEISGTGDDARGEKAIADLPSDLYFAGSVVPSDEAEMSGLSEDLQAKLSPPAIQAAFRLDPGRSRDQRLTVTVSGHVYYRSFPTVEEQFDRTHLSVGELEEDEPPSEQSNDDEFVRVYRRIEFESDPIEIGLPELGQIEAREIVEGTVEDVVIDELVDRVRERILEIDRNAVSPSESDSSEAAPPVWRAAADIAAPEAIDVSDLPGAPDGATVSVDDFSGEYQFPGGLFDHDDRETQRLVLDEVVDRIVSRAQDRPMVPTWDLDVQCDFTDDDGYVRGELVVENTSEPSADTSGYDTEYGANVYDTTVFDLTATLEIEGGSFEDFTFERLEDDFRYDRHLPGHGTGCTVSRVDDQTLETTYLPTYRQEKYETRDPESFDPPLDTTFETLTDLRNGGLDALDNVADQMREYHGDVYERHLENYRREDDWRDEDEEEFERDWDAFQTEIERFERGIDCLRWDLEEGAGHVARSFELMNETFVKKVTDEDGVMEYDSWRLFQLVFILRVLPDIVSREYDEWAEVTWRDGDEATDYAGEELEALDVVDIVWFPTGGGKTEAYLGLAIFNAFFDRKRGKSYGVTAWTRFPLRLLSLQQTQRIGELLMHAELLRLEESDISGDEHFPFTLGYLVGSKNTPNKVSNYVDTYRDDDDVYLREFNKFAEGEGSDERREEIKIFPSCPVCGADVELRATDDLRLAHHCTAPESACPYQRRPRPTSEEYQIFAADELPVHIVDNELYRYAPTMIVGTIDKITAVGYERKSAHVYAGKMSHWCPDHGFASFEECTEKYGCHGQYAGSNSDDGSHLVPLEETPFGHAYDAAPGLQVQDELHLLEETLGTFDSHFETFTDLYQRYNDEQRTKIVGATATIEEYDDQVEDLYLRKAERFPEEGPALGENFYATTKESTRRRFAGIMPHGKTHINAVIQINYYYLRAIERLRERLESTSTRVDEIDELGFELVDTNDELLNLLSIFETSLTYTISKRDKNRYNQSMRGQIAGYLREDGLPEPRLEELTGDTPFDDVEDILDNLEDPPAATEERYNVIAATNMISHGVDVERFNFMVFFGMPRQTAEYIQSSSRAGRVFPGNILVCFNPARERDQSHYHLFQKYHEFLDRLVEPVPVNRWSHYSVERTLPSMIFGWLLNQWLYETGDRLYFGDQASDLVRQLEAGNGSQVGVSIDDTDDYVELLVRSYGADLCGELPGAFETLLEHESDRIFSQLEDIQATFASDALNPGPMRSLRDIDEQIPFKPHDDDNRRLFNTLSQR